jgi:Leucine-rich repeat (LRR) protein
MNGKVPDSIGQLILLTGLRLYENNISGVLPIGICELLELKTLSLYNNELTGIHTTSYSKVLCLTASEVSQG